MKTVKRISLYSIFVTIWLCDARAHCVRLCATWQQMVPNCNWFNIIILIIFVLDWRRHGSNVKQTVSTENAIQMRRWLWRAQCTHRVYRSYYYVWAQVNYTCVLCSSIIQRVFAADRSGASFYTIAVVISLIFHFIYIWQRAKYSSAATARLNIQRYTTHAETKQI